MAFTQGKIKTHNFDYYNGSKSTITFRSSWEWSAFQRLEQLGKLGRIQGWSSEDVIIPYKFDLDGSSHRYFMDLKIDMPDKVVLVEIKPYKETFIPSKPKTFKNEIQKRNYENHLMTCIKNQNKWKYTLLYCAHMSEITGKPWTFQIWSEKVSSKTEKKNTFVREVF